MPFDFAFDPVDDLDRFVYHYTSVEAVFDGILPTGLLRLSPFANVNDPREAKDWQISLAGGQNDTATHELIIKFQREINRIGKSNCKLLCMTSDCPFAKGHITACFSRGYGHPRLWAQYAQNHRGICLVFDRTKLDTVIRNHLTSNGHISCAKVKYSNFERREGSAFQLWYDDIVNRDAVEFAKQHIISHSDVFFYQKSADWSQEVEFRWVLVDEKPGHVHVPFGSSLVAVIRGADHRNTKATAAILRGLGVKLGQMCWSNGVPAAMEYWHKA